MLASPATAADAVRTIATPLFSVTLGDGGGFTVTRGGQSYAVESTFSYPQMPADGWNALRVAVDPSPREEWQVASTTAADAFDITARGPWYALRRHVAVRDDHILIQDTFTNTSVEDVAIAFDNKVTSGQQPREINVGGKYVSSRFPYNARYPSKNPTIFIAGPAGGIGLVALDDYYRLQYALKQDGRAAWFENRSFGLASGDSYTFEWALYPTATDDYYDFINLVRRDHVKPVTIEGGCAFLAYQSVLEWPREVLADWLRHRHAKIVILVGGHRGAPWLGGYAKLFYDLAGDYDEAAHLRDLKKAREILRSIDPEVRCIGPFETALTPELPAGEFAPRFPDSTAYLPDGTPDGWHFPVNPEARREFEQTKAHAYISYPTLDNSYYRHMRDIIERALREADLDGIYFDIFTYASSFRWTYDRWDGRTVDIDPRAFTIARKKAELTKLSEDARAELVQFILDFKPGNVVVANHPPVAAKLRGLPIYSFTETLADYGYVLSHFSTPIMLGWTKGYNDNARSIDKAGTWWEEWATDADYFQDIRDKLSCGNLYYTYWTPPGRMNESTVTRSTILSRMFPVTVEEIRAGSIKGPERIITLHSGTYSWGDDRPAMAWVYDAEGRESPGELATARRDDGTLEFRIEVPPGGAAVIERPCGGRSCGDSR